MPTEYIINSLQSPGKFGAGPRFVLELRPFLSDIFKEDVVTCQLCRETVVRVRL